MQIPVFYRQLASMGTRLEIVIPGLEESNGLQLVREIENELALLVQHLSNYDPDSAISKFNSLPVGETMEISGYFSDFIQSGLRYNTLTMGYYDFTLGAWTSKPDLIPDNGSRLAKLMKVPFQDRLQVHKGTAGPTIQDIRLDSGGIGKGMAIFSIEKLLRNYNIQSAFISFGGSSVLGLGKHPYGDSWKVGITDPGEKESMVSQLDLLDMTLSISGNSLNNRKKYGNGGHILNPLNGDFYTKQGLVAVVSGSAVEAEVLSTALILCKQEEEEQILSGFKDVRIYRYEKD